MEGLNVAFMRRRSQKVSTVEWAGHKIRQLQGNDGSFLSKEQGIWLEDMLKKVGLWIMCGVVFLVAHGCKGPLVSHEQIVAVQPLAISAQSYRLGPNDSLQIEVFDEPDLLTETTVSGHGTIKFPLLGELRVAGMTVKEVEEELARRLAEGYLKNPKLTVSIKQYRNFYVSGEARRPGAFPYREGITILKAITLAGGWTDRAVKDEAKVLRMVNGHQQMLIVGMEDSVQPDDIIIVPESFF